MRLVFMGTPDFATASLSEVLARGHDVAVIGGAIFEVIRRRFALQWGEVQGDIEAAIRAREAA